MVADDIFVDEILIESEKPKNIDGKNVDTEKSTSIKNSVVVIKEKEKKGL